MGDQVQRQWRAKQRGMEADPYVSPGRATCVTYEDNGERLLCWGRGVKIPVAHRTEAVDDHVQLQAHKDRVRYDQLTGFLFRLNSPRLGRNSVSAP